MSSLDQACASFAMLLHLHMTVAILSVSFIVIMVVDIVCILPLSDTIIQDHYHSSYLVIFTSRHLSRPCLLSCQYSCQAADSSGWPEEVLKVGRRSY